MQKRQSVPEGWQLPFHMPQPPEAHLTRLAMSQLVSRVRGPSTSTPFSVTIVSSYCGRGRRQQDCQPPLKERSRVVETQQETPHAQDSQQQVFSDPLRLLT